MDDESSKYDKLESMLQDGSSEPCNLSLEYLKNITNNFSDERLLGQGGFGTVYKGVLPNGETIAVKKLNSSMPGVKDRHFENESCHLTRLKHPNVVLLVGWCSEAENIYVQYDGKYICAEKSERLLCFEYMPKGSLRGYLSDEASGLGWDIRYKIIEGICCGLHYLHEEWQHNAPVIHMDLKPANILLDNNMVPKIADFGLSRLFSEEKTWTCTINRDGTLGYMAPEYINRGLITTKSDIFSLGVIIIEIVTGHRQYPDEEIGISSQEFIECVLKNWRNRLQKTLGHTTLEIYYQQIRKCIQIGLVCVNLDRSKRPATTEIVKMLHCSESADFSGRKETYLQSASLRIEEMRLKSHDTNQWMSYRHLPENLKERIHRYEQYRWQETSGVDEEQLLMNLPKDLTKDIKRHLCLSLLMRDPMYRNIFDHLLDAMCDRLKPILYTDGSCIVIEGDSVTEILFIMRGNIMSTTGGSTGFFNFCVLEGGDFCGEELLTWALYLSSRSSLPRSMRTLKTISEVEAFTLRAEDLSFVVTQFRLLHSKRLQHTFRFYSQPWRNWAACFIQAGWHRYCRKKLEDSLREKEKRLQKPDEPNFSVEEQ